MVLFRVCVVRAGEAKLRERVREDASQRWWFERQDVLLLLLLQRISCQLQPWATTQGFKHVVENPEPYARVSRILLKTLGYTQGFFRMLLKPLAIRQGSITV